METGIRVARKTQAPLTFPGMLSTPGHCDQSRFARAGPPFFGNNATRNFDTHGLFVSSGHRNGCRGEQ
jgi:hypothetical protein